ncbi:MAG: UPF0182 family protein [Gemmatimonadaceae bacterium]
MGSRRWVVGTVVAIALLLLAGRALAGWYVDFRWYESLGAAEVWQVRTWNLFLLRGTTFLVGSIFVFANLFAVRASVASLILPRRVGNLEIGEEVPGRYLFAGVVVLTIVIAAMLAIPRDDWMSLELIRHGERFGETDPYFQFDLSFWLYWLPLETALHLWALIAMLTVTLLVLFLYALTPSLRWEGGRLHVTGYVRRHLFALGAAMLVLLGWNYRLDAYALLNGGSGAMGGFTAIDHKVGIPVNLVLALITVAAAMLVIWSGWMGQVRLAFFSVSVVLLVSLTLRQAVPPVAQRFVTPGDPDVRERPYLTTRAGYTRRAYDVDRLTKEDSSPAPVTGVGLRGAALWDAPALEQAAGRSGRNPRPAGSLGWDVVDGRPIALAVSPPTGPDAADPVAGWTLTRYAADVAGERGAPVERLDAASSDASVARAVLVFDSVSSYLVLSDSADRVAGSDLSTLSSRIAHAWSLQNPRLLGSEVPARGRIILRRSVRERVEALYPFFVTSPNVQPMAWRDSLLWVMHLYTASIWYPLSDVMHFGDQEVHYLRHAAVAIVNAHTGRVRAIADQTPDPIAVTWMRRFPSLFVASTEVEQDLTNRLPPAVDGALVQAAAFAQVGVRGEYLPPSHLPKWSGGDRMFTLDRTSPFVDANSKSLSVSFPVLDAADRLRGLVTVSGGATYEPRWHELRSASPRWGYVLERLLRLPDSVTAAIPRDAHILRGPVRVLPVGNGVAFVQTAYAGRSDGSVQALATAVLNGDSLGIGTTIAAAVGMPEPRASETPLTAEEFKARIASIYADMREAMRRGDFRAFGASYEALGRLLQLPTR